MREQSNFLTREEFNNGLRVLIEKISQVRNLVEEALGQQEEYLSVPEFAKQISLSPSRVREMCVMGLIKATQSKPKGKWSILRSEVTRFRKNAIDNHFNNFKRKWK